MTLAFIPEREILAICLQVKLVLCQQKAKVKVFLLLMAALEILVWLISQLKYLLKMVLPQRSREEKQLITKKHRNIAEFAFGTNPKAKITGVTLEDEKAEGTVHIALGNNKSYGGNANVPFHANCIIKKPDVFIDGKKIMNKGKFII